MLPKKITAEERFDELLMSDWLRQERHSLLRYIDNTVVPLSLNNEVRVSSYDQYLRDQNYLKHMKHQMVREISEELFEYLITKTLVTFEEEEDKRTGDVIYTAKLRVGMVDNLPRFKAEMEQAIKELTDDYEDL